MNEFGCGRGDGVDVVKVVCWKWEVGGFEREVG